jgi:hypothetical protein
VRARQERGEAAQLFGQASILPPYRSNKSTSRRIARSYWIRLNVAGLDRGVAAFARSAHSAAMAKKVCVPIFEFQQIGDEWQFRVHLAAGVSDYITGFKSRVEADRWLSGDERLTWLRQHGYAG